MRKIGLVLVFLCLPTFYLIRCTTPYNPPAVKGNNQFLVVDGTIRNGPDSTIITLSRSANLGDSTPPQPELNARIVIEGQTTGVYPLAELGEGSYGIAQLNLDPSQMYKLQITTSNGEQFASDFVPVRQSPPIDSLHFVGDSSGCTIYLSTHDPSNNTRYYQWDFTQTWEHDSYYNSTIELQPGGVVVPRPPDQQIYRCWSSSNSTDILVASSQNLSQDVISLFPIYTIPEGSVMLSVQYSILVRQYAITEQAYQYWLSLKQNTELTGSIFQPQPSSVQGNIHDLTNPAEPAFGYVSISSVDSMRILINDSQLGFWNYISPLSNCSYWGPQLDSLAYYATLPNIYTPFVVCIGPACFTALAYRYCVDCGYFGGSYAKPSYWPF